MTITFKAYTTNSGSGTTTVTVPTGTAQGDIMLAFFGAGTSATRIPSAPATGWTSVASTGASPGPYSALYYKVAGASETSSTWTNSSGSTEMICVTFTGIVPNIFGTISTQYQNSATGSNPVSSITTTHVGLLVLFNVQPNNNSFTLPGGFTSIFDASIGTPEFSVSSMVNSTAGATGTLTTGFGGSGCCSILIQLYDTGTAGNNFFFGTNA